MKKLSFIFTVLTVTASIFFTGCDGISDIRANPVSLEVNGDLFTCKPDTIFTHGTNIYDASVYQAPDEFVFTLHEVLHGKRRKTCVLNLTFRGIGSIQTGHRYPLELPDAGETPDPQPFSYGGNFYEITEGWIEFTEYGVNTSGDRAYVSGTFGLTAKDKSIKITNGSFGRLLECKLNYVAEK